MSVKSMTKRRECKHGVLLGVSCFECHRERKQEEKRKKIEERIKRQAEKLDW